MEQIPQEPKKEGKEELMHSLDISLELIEDHMSGARMCAASTSSEVASHEEEYMDKAWKEIREARKLLEQLKDGS